MAGFWRWVKGVLGVEPKPEAAGGTPSTEAGATGAGSAASAGSAEAGDGAAAPSPRRSFGRPDVLGLSQKALRERAMSLSPFAWSFERRDRIPDPTPLRTALIDRGLVLSGRLRQAELDEMRGLHEEWLAYAEPEAHARLAAYGAGEAAVQAHREAKAAERARRRAEAEARRVQRAADIAERRAHDIVFLGPRVSKGLADRRSLVEKLEAAGLPVLATPKDVADWLGLSVPRLRWLAFQGDAVQRAHYVRFTVPKRSGGERVLHAPHAELKAVQRKILAELLERIDAGPHVHGFVRGRSTVSHARPHVGQDVVLALDLADFFPTITFWRVRGLYRSLGYSPAAATVLAALCTEAPRREVRYDGVVYQVAIGDPCLPQGAPTSPALSNLVARGLDRRVAGLAAKQGWVYTRYADDLALSKARAERWEVPQLIGAVTRIAADEGFVLHPQKRRVLRRAGQQTVTGVVVNDRLSMPRAEVRRLRAILHRARRTGLAGENREHHPHFAAWLRGKLAYLAMIDPEKGRRMLAELDAIEGRGPSPT